jgi:hypothetical protein
MDNNFKQFVNNLKKTNQSTHLESLDITWNTPNILLNSNELLFIILTKTSMIPFIPDYTTTAEQFGLTNEQALSVQESNELVLVLHKMIQQYCIQQFCIGSIMKTEIDKLIFAAPEIKDVQSIDDLLAYMNNFKKEQGSQPQIQTGGGPGSFLKLMGTLILLTFLITISKSDGISLGNQNNQTQQLVLINGDVINPYNQQMINMSLEDLSQQLQDKLSVQSKKPVSVNNIVVKYDDEVEKNKIKILQNFLAFFPEPKSGVEFLNDIIDNFNSGLLRFSRDVETGCAELMDKANEKGIFGHYIDFDNSETTKQKISEVEIAVKNYNSALSQDIVESATAAAAGVVTAVATGDFTTIGAYVADLGIGVWTSLTNTKNILEQQNKTLSENKSLMAQSDGQLTPSQKKLLEDNIYQFSKVYCSYGYHLQLQLQQDVKNVNINVVGDKIEYQWIIDIINLLESNIDLKISTSVIRKELNKYELNALNSLKQRIQVLKAITIKLRTIVNFSIQSQIYALNIQPTRNSLSEMDIYFKSQLTDLSNMLESLKKQFPKREEDLKQETLLSNTKIALDKFEDKLKLHEKEAEFERQSITNNITLRNSEMIAQNISENWSATKILGVAYVTVFGDQVRFMGASAGNTTEALGDAVLAIPLGGYASALKFTDSIIWLTLWSTTGLGLITVGLCAFAIWAAGLNNTIYVFVWMGKTFVAIITLGIMTVYRLIATPFGWIFQRQDVIAGPFLRDAMPLQAERGVRTRIPRDDDINAAAQSLLELGRTGGKIRTKRQRHKQKAKKTRRKRKNKNTSKRRNKPNKYSRRRK